MAEGEMAERLAQIRRRVDEAARRAGRDPGQVSLVAVTKTVELEPIRTLIGLGVNDLGENRVQEALPKQEALGGLPVKWHMIGHLQTNKVRQVVGWCAMLHSLDRISLARELQKRLQKTNAGPLECLIQVNTREDPDGSPRSGMAPEAVPDFVRQAAAFDRLRVVGLMTMAPPVPDPSDARPYFRRLRELSEQVAGLGLPGVSMRHLSMGMTGDFEAAVEEGATLVRIGRALFGERPQ
ncbi:MAG: YggS family pyridoxal phosphate-dependent enzyme [Thermaerobacterales bacterium]